MYDLCVYLSLSDRDQAVRMSNVYRYTSTPSLYKNRAIIKWKNFHSKCVLITRTTTTTTPLTISIASSLSVLFISFLSLEAAGLCLEVSWQKKASPSIRIATALRRRGKRQAYFPTQRRFVSHIKQVEENLPHYRLWVFPPVRREVCLYECICV